MIWKVQKSALNGTIPVPPSKSHTIRAILVAMCADGISHLDNVLTKGDGGSALDAARGFGAEVSIFGKQVEIKGLGHDFNKGSHDIFFGNSGTSTSLFSSIAALGTKRRRFDGDNSLRSRPFRSLLDALTKLGAKYTCERPDGDLPFSIQGSIKGGTTTVSGVNSQFVSSLLFGCGLAQGDTIITIENLCERPYVELTLWWLDKMGIRYSAATDLGRITIFGGQRYHSIDCAIAGDFSSATFGCIAAAVTASTVELSGIDFSDPQGDKKIFDDVAGFGVLVEKTKTGAIVSGRQPLQSCDVDLNSTPDALPAMAVLACAATGTTRLHNVAQARIKETDRIKVMTEELSKMGAQIRELPDGLEVSGTPLHGAVVNGHDDHRVVMALALAGVIASGETVIETAQAADVTYPTFATDFISCGAKITVES